MSDKSQARRIQREKGVAYSTALSWVRDPAVKAAASVRKEQEPARPFADIIVEMAIHMKWRPR